MERLSALDASFLQLETSAAHMHVGWRSHLETPPRERLDVGRLTEQIARRLPQIPRFSQRLAWPSPLLDPLWMDDPRFELGEHIAVAENSRAFTREEATRRCNDFLGTSLDRRRPLWELLIAPRVSQAGAVIAGKVHHAMVDGLAAVELGMLLFDASADVGAEPGDRAVPELVAAQEPPSFARIAASAAADTALEQFRFARATFRAGLSPRRSARIAETMRRAALSLTEDVVTRPAPPTPLNVPIGPRRELYTARVPLARVNAIKQRSGAKLNDVVLAAAAGALDALLGDHHDIRAMVPVSVRGDDRAVAGNRIAFAFVDLPLAERRPTRRLELIAERMDKIKRDGSIGGADALLRSLGGLPAPFRAQVARAAAGPRIYNLVISNVIGPPLSLFAAGARVREIYPAIPLSESHALALGVLTYDEHLHFAWHAEPDALPRARMLPLLLERALGALERGSTPHRGRGRLSAAAAAPGSGRP